MKLKTTVAIIICLTGSFSVLSSTDSNSSNATHLQHNYSLSIQSGVELQVATGRIYTAFENFYKDLSKHKNGGWYTIVPCLSAGEIVNAMAVQSAVPDDSIQMVGGSRCYSF